MPTTRPRHTITETPPVHDALEPLRAELADERIDFAELVILGALAKLTRLRRERPETVEARAWLARRIRERSLPVDLRAADEAKRIGLIAPGGAGAPDR